MTAFAPYRHYGSLPPRGALTCAPPRAAARGKPTTGPAVPRARRAPAAAPRLLRPVRARAGRTPPFQVRAVTAVNAVTAADGGRPPPRTVAAVQLTPGHAGPTPVMASMTRVYAADVRGTAPARRGANADRVGQDGTLADFPASHRHAEARKATGRKAADKQRAPCRVSRQRAEPKDNLISASPVPPPFRCGSQSEGPDFSPTRGPCCGH